MICISKHEITRWNYSLHRCNYEIIMNHIASRSCRRLSYKTSELHFEISLRRFSFHRSPSSYRKEGKKFKRKSIRRNPTRFGNPANSFRFSRPILIAAVSREEHCSENTGEIFEISVISMSQNSRSSARKSLDSVRGITNGVHGDEDQA